MRSFQVLVLASCIASVGCNNKETPTQLWNPELDVVSSTCPTPLATVLLSPLETGADFLTPPAIVNLDDGTNIKVAQRISGIGGSVGRLTFRVSHTDGDFFGGDRVLITLQTDDAGKPSGLVLSSTDAGEQVGTSMRGGFFPVGTSQVAPRPDLFIPAGSTWDGTLDPAATYWLVFERRDPTTAGYYFLGADNSNPYPGGEILVFNGATWNSSAVAGLDLIIELRGAICLESTNSFQLPGRNIRGLAYDNGFLWAVHSAEGSGNLVKISKIDPGTGEVLQESSSLIWNGRGITVGAGSLWIVDALADVIHRVNPSDFSEIGSFGTPGGEPTGIAFDGSNLWLTDPVYPKIFQLSTTGTLVANFGIPNAFRQALEWEGNGMWTTTGATELSHYLPSGMINATRTLQGLPSGTQISDIAIGSGRIYLASGSTVYVQGWLTQNRIPIATACITRSAYVTSTDPTDCAHTARVAGNVTPANSSLPSVVLRGDRSADPDGDGLSYIWTEGSEVLGTESVIDVTGKLIPGQHTVVLRVDDHMGGVSQDQVTVTVTDLVVLVHGWNGSASSFSGTLSRMADLLGDDFTVMSFDYSGKTGCSTGFTIQSIASDFSEYINTLLPTGSKYIGRTNILAHSMGGLVVRWFMTGRAGRPYRSEFSRVALAGTPNYGAPLASLAAVCLSVQGLQMRLGSTFLWQLDSVWTLTRPIPADNMLTVVGSVGGSLGCLFNGKVDGVVPVTSAALPSSTGEHVVYVPYKHFTLGFSNCSVPTLVGAPDANHHTYRVTRSFFTRAAVVPPPDPRPDSIKTFGMLVVNLRDFQTGGVVTDLKEGDFSLTSGTRLARCDGRSGGQYRALVCDVNSSSGTATLLDVPGGNWILAVKHKGTVNASQFVSITAGRPTSILIRLIPR